MVRKNPCLILTARDVSKFIREMYFMPNSVYKDEDNTQTVMSCRNVFEENPKVKKLGKKKKPTKF